MPSQVAILEVTVRMFYIKSYADRESTARTTADVYVSNAVMDQKGVEDLVDSFLFALELYMNPSVSVRSHLSHFCVCTIILWPLWHIQY